jgi:hypothetical protein
MSAFVVDKAHIDLLLGAGMRASHLMSWKSYNRGYRRLDNCDEVGQMLVDENVRSVMRRYPDTMDGRDLPGPVDAYWQRPYRFASPAGVDFVDALEAIDVYEYQACEHPEWETSEARAFCDALRRGLTRMLPGAEASQG